MTRRPVQTERSSKLVANRAEEADLTLGYLAQPCPLRAPLLRWHNATGDPEVHDGDANPRALAVKFQLAGGKYADVLGLSIEPRFPQSVIR